MRAAAIFLALAALTGAARGDCAAVDHRKMVRDRHQTCRPDGSETLNGVAADIFRLQRDGGFSERVWIARAGGLPLRAGNEYEGGMQSLEVFDYANVAPPAGVR